MTPLVMSRRAVEVVRESVYGVDPGTEGLFPAFIQADEGPEFEGTEAEATFATQAFGGGRMRHRNLFGQWNPLRTMILQDAPAAWIPLLEASGFKQVSDVRWEAVQTPTHTSLTVRSYMDGLRAVQTGVRASLSLQAVAGGPISVDATLSGAAMAEGAAGTPSRGYPMSPVRLFCEANAFFTLEDVGVRRPKGLQEIAIDTGTVLAGKQVSHATAGVRWRVQNVVPQVRVNFEERVDWRWVEDRERAIAFTVTLGGWRWEFPKMGMAGLPQRVRLSSGLAGTSLVLREIADWHHPVSVTWVG